MYDVIREEDVSYMQAVKPAKRHNLNLIHRDLSIH